jgi:hypothetical protein
MKSGTWAVELARRAMLKSVAVLGIVVLVLGATGCFSTAHWVRSKKAPGYFYPGRATLVLKWAPNVDKDADDGGNVTAMLGTLQEELANRGLVLKTDQASAKTFPRLTLTVLSSYGGNPALNYFVVVGNASMSVLCELTMAEGQPPAFRGEIRGAQVGRGADDMGTGGEAIGREIAEAIAEPADDG